jgi:hypothetical protein
MSFIALLLLPTGGVSGTVVETMSLKDLTHAADVVFAGTVDSIRTDVVRVQRGPRDEMPVRSVYFSRLEFAKGTRHDALVLRVAGFHAIGPLAPEGTAVDLRRQLGYTFETGRRYVVLCDSSLGSASNHYSPMVGFHQGYYILDTDRTTGAYVVHDRDYRPITGIAMGVAIPLVDPDPETRVSEAMFLEAIRTFTEP